MNITISDIVALSNAGFTKAEIIALTSQTTPPVQTVPAQTTVPVQTAPAQTVPVQTTPAQTTVPVQQNSVAMSNEQFTTLLQSINAGNASIDLPPSYNIDNVLANHYKTLMVGDHQKKGD